LHVANQCAKWKRWMRKEARMREGKEEWKYGMEEAQVLIQEKQLQADADAICDRSNDDEFDLSVGRLHETHVLQLSVPQRSVS